MSVCNLLRYKGIHENLQALHRLDLRGLKNWHYCIVGDGPYREKLGQMAKELHLDDRVTFRGHLPFGDAIRVIRAADFFCLPSWAEPFGNVYAEAAVCGRAAIGCRGFGAEWIIREGETGLLVPPKDVSALSDAIEFLLTHPAQAQVMGEQAREHIRQFTWARTAQAYADVLTNITSGV